MEKGEESDSVSVKDLAVSIFDLAEDLYAFEYCIWIWCCV